MSNTLLAILAAFLIFGLYALTYNEETPEPKKVVFGVMLVDKWDVRHIREGKLNDNGYIEVSMEGK